MWLKKAVFIFSLFISQSVFAQNSVKEQVTQLYKDYFCPADQVDPQWDGDFLQLNHGTISAEYKNATLKRLMFMRALAGINNNIEINETLNAQAQHLSFFFSINGNEHVYSNAWDPFRIINANLNNPNYDPYYIFRYYSPQLQQIAKISHIGTYDTIANALIDIIRSENGEDATTSGGEHDPDPKRGYPFSTLKLLSPQLTSVGIGSIETNTPIKYQSGDDINSLHIERMSSGVMTTNNFDLNIPGGSDFNPVLWPPPGYVPYIVSGPKWIAYQPGADFRSAFVSVKAANDPTFQYKARLLERDASVPENMISWSMDAFPGQGRGFNNPSLTAEDRNYEVTIGNILFNGQIKELKYNVIEYNPFTDFTKTKIKIDILDKISGSYANFIRFRVHTEDGCLIRIRPEALLTGSITGGRNLKISAGYSTSPTGPFNELGDSFTPGVHDVVTEGEKKEGFYQFEFLSAPAAIGGQGKAPILLQRSEVFQLSNLHGFRRLTEQFKEPVPLIDIATIDHKVKSDTPGGPKPEYTVTPEPNITPNPGSDGDNGNALLDKMMKKFKKLKVKNNECKLKKKQNSCRDSKCQTQCSKTKKNFTALKAEIIRMTGTKP